MKCENMNLWSHAETQRRRGGHCVTASHCMTATLFSRGGAEANAGWATRPTMGSPSRPVPVQHPVKNLNSENSAILSKKYGAHAETRRRKGTLGFPMWGFRRAWSVEV